MLQFDLLSGEFVAAAGFLLHHAAIVPILYSLRSPKCFEHALIDFFKNPGKRRIPSCRIGPLANEGVNVLSVCLGNDRFCERNDPEFQVSFARLELNKFFREIFHAYF